MLEIMPALPAAWRQTTPESHEAALVRLVPDTLSRYTGFARSIQNCVKPEHLVPSTQVDGVPDTCTTMLPPAAYCTDWTTYVSLGASVLGGQGVPVLTETVQVFF